MSQLFHIEDFEELFTEVQLARIFPDSKTFADATPRLPISDILKKHRQERRQESFSLLSFIQQNFDLPLQNDTHFVSDTSNTAEAHINRLWDVLTKTSGGAKSTKLLLPNKFIIPGGRFREFFYWDSYFTMLGLQASGRTDLIENMVDNFAYLIDTYGYIPNGTRTYLLSRSQPPFFSFMIELLSEEKGKPVYVKYLPQLKAEYQFWMKGTQLLTKNINDYDRVVLLGEGEILNRYWDNLNIPRAEGYYEDVREYEKSAPEAKPSLYRNIRAACESGWDFSGRWFSDEKNLSTIQTTHLIPVDLNCLLWHLETTISISCRLAGKTAEEKSFSEKADRRANAIQKYLWNEREACFLDYDFIKQESSFYRSMAMAFPLFIKIATKQQADSVVSIIEKDFLQPGGLTTSLSATGQQWDGPNGWAPLQWVGYKAAKNYDKETVAALIKANWTNNVERVFKATGKMMEKYNVTDTQLAAGGGEYENQDGFGWTNGVYLKMIKE